MKKYEGLATELMSAHVPTPPGAVKTRHVEGRGATYLLIFSAETRVELRIRHVQMISPGPQPTIDGVEGALTAKNAGSLRSGAMPALFHSSRAIWCGAFRMIIRKEVGRNKIWTCLRLKIDPHTPDLSSAPITIVGLEYSDPYLSGTI